MSDLHFDEYNCICGTVTYLKKDGTPWKHQTPQGAHCFGSSDPEVDLADVKEAVFEYDVTVFASNPMIEEEAWQFQNRSLATVAATLAGKFPLAEATLKSRTEEGPKIRFTYVVPVGEG